MKGIFYSTVFALLWSKGHTAYAQSVLYELKKMQLINSYDSYLINDNTIFFIRLGLFILIVIVGVCFVLGNAKWKARKNTRRDR